MKVLYIEDNPVDIDLTLRHFKKAAPHMDVKIAQSQTEALKIIKESGFSKFAMVLTDMHLPDGDGIAILSHIRGHSIPVSVVLLTGQGDEESAVAALKAGADDYIVKKKGYLEKLPQLLEDAHASYRQGEDRKVNELNVLYVEHNQADVDLAIRHFEKHASHIHLTMIYSVTEFYQLLDDMNRLSAYDVLMLDYRLPRENALEILKRMRDSSSPKIPVILITGKGDEEIAVKALKLGAFDYVTKIQGYLFKLPSVIENAYYNMQLAREHEALLESEKRYRSLFENNHVVMLLIDPETGDIVDANQAAVNFYGWPKEVLKAKKIEEINSLSPREIKKEMQRAVKESRNYFLFKHRRADNSLCDVEVYSAPIAVGGRSLLYSVVYDITQRISYQKEKEKLRAQLIQAQKMEAVGQLAGGIAHDFNNILSSIIGFTELTLDEVEKGSSIENHLQEVYAAGKRAKDLVKQILAFARQTEETLRPVQVKPIIKEVLKFIRSSIPTTIEIRQRIESNANILGNPTQVHQILMNLLTNAAHAMENKGGILEVHLQDISFHNNEKRDIPDFKQGNYIEIKVSDTGTGIPSEIIDSIFDPYFTTKAPGEGTGMGLATVHGIVESYNGKITVHSAPGKGTCFTIYLPVTSERNTLHSHEPGKLPKGDEKILFIDDEVPIAKMGRQMLKRLGYSVTTHTSSIEALELFRATPDDFDLVITDMTMPNMTGDELAIELMKIRPDIPVIICTGYSKKISNESAAHMGIKAIAYKPMVKKDLAIIIRKVLDGKIKNKK